jgi:hypothetical protein
MSSTAQPASTTADMFQLIWTTLVGVLGATASATLVRRAARNAVAKRPQCETLRMLDVTREGMQYRCDLPPSWDNDKGAHLNELRYLFQSALCPLLEELTGTVVIRMLERHPELQRQGFAHNEEALS